jgi:hypothetical protein
MNIAATIVFWSLACASADIWDAAQDRQYLQLTRMAPTPRLPRAEHMRPTSTSGSRAFAVFQCAGSSMEARTYSAPATVITNCTQRLALQVRGAAPARQYNIPQRRKENKTCCSTAAQQTITSHHMPSRCNRAPTARWSDGQA